MASLLMYSLPDLHFVYRFCEKPVLVVSQFISAMLGIFREYIIAQSIPDSSQIQLWMV